MKPTLSRVLTLSALFATIGLGSASGAAAALIEGRVEGGGGPVAHATVTLWAAGQSTPGKLAETQTSENGTFALQVADGIARDTVLYVIASGGEPTAGGVKGPNSAIVLMATLGTTLPKRVTISELTTVASVWTGAQFLHGTALSGTSLGLRIAAGNVPNLVDLETGGLGRSHSSRCWTRRRVGSRQ